MAISNYKTPDEQERIKMFNELLAKYIKFQETVKYR